MSSCMQHYKDRVGASFEGKCLLVLGCRRTSVGWMSVHWCSRTFWEYIAQCVTPARSRSPLCPLAAGLLP